MSTQEAELAEAHGSVPNGELTAYEEVRKPHLPILDANLVQLPQRVLLEETRCPICISLIDQTHTTKDCLHRFCAACITDSLRIGKKECPTCRKPCASRRSLRPDPAFDTVIRLVYPDRDAYEAQELEMMAKLREHHNQTALAQSVEEGMRRQAQTRYRRINKQDLDEDAPIKKHKSLSDESLLCLPLQQFPILEEAVLHIELAADEPPEHGQSVNIPQKYLNAPASCTARHIRQFVWIQYGVLLDSKPADELFAQLKLEPSLLNTVVLRHNDQILDDELLLSNLLDEPNLATSTVILIKTSRVEPTAPSAETD